MSEDKRYRNGGITLGGIIVAAGIFLGLYADGGVVCSDIREHLDPQYRSRITETKRDEEPSSERQRSRRIRTGDSIEERVINPPKEVQIPTLEIRVEDGKESARYKCDKYTHLPNLILLSHFRNGNEASRLHCVNGKPEGEEIVLYENGQSARKGNFVRGKPVGKHFEWHENGQVAADRTFVNGVIVGKQFGWHANGEKSWEQNYNQGKLSGQQFKWYDNKQQNSIANYINGVKEGLQLGWHSNGNPNFEKNYVNGKEDGEQLNWYKSGQFYSREEFQNGREISNQTRWYANGFKSDEVRYNYDNQRERTCRWDESGKVTEAETCRYWHSTYRELTFSHNSCKHEPNACGNQLDITPRMRVNEQDRLLDEQTRLPASVEPINLEE